VSLVFLSPFVGYVLSATLNNTLHKKIGQRWLGFLCGLCHTVAYLIVCQHPPYPLLVIAYAFAGFGNGIGDAAWNAWVGNLAQPSELLGFMHAIYGAGGTVSPLIATAMITRGNLEWYTFYYIMVSSRPHKMGASNLKRSLLTPCLAGTRGHRNHCLDLVLLVEDCTTLSRNNECEQHQ
jgi:fucose permease